MTGCCSCRSLVLGFVAGAVATVTAHEIILHLLNAYGFPAPRAAWPMTPIDQGPLASLGIPKIVSATFWGGVWGMIFAAIWGNTPQGPLTLKGALLGIAGPAIIGLFVLVPLLTKKHALFFADAPELIAPVLLVLAGFGAVTGWLYGFLTSGCRLP